MNDLQPFVFPETGQHVRTVVIDDEPWFVAADVCAVLAVSNPRSSVALLDEDEKGVHSIDTPGGEQQVSTVNEPGLYSLILRSRRPEAKAFKRWLKRDVLPSIRRTGGYALEQKQLSRKELARNWYEAEVRAEEAELRVAELEPKAQSWDVFASADGDFDVKAVADALSRDPKITLGRNRLFDYMVEIGWCYRTQGSGRARAYQSAVERGWLAERLRTRDHPERGRIAAEPQVRITTKGAYELHRRLGGASPLLLPIGGAA